eukprot:TRINITY_DN3049_c0_g3_i1.p1 TRINITY_DN3049_c0_g3~~TRINITY_DN3049_c0_g3_i1.p1  ORF type:complete len:493 (+),score=150.61 TRINITY_DN3049_c0_g3_i1:85-1479(+)
MTKLVAIVAILLSISSCSGFFTQRTHMIPTHPLSGSPQWFDQTLDHFNANDQTTFKQKFFVIDQYLGNPSNTMFLYISGEGPCSGVPNDYVVQMAKSLQGLVVTLEHRYFGDSQPFTSLTTENYKYLTVEQSLADLENIRQHINKQYGNSDTKWIVVGGSYSGALSAFFRQTYPDSVVGSIASSGVVEATLAFDAFDEQVALSAGTQCANALRETTAQIEVLLNKSNETNAQIKQEFGARMLEDGDFLYMVADCGAELIQYGFHNQLCGPMTASSSQDLIATFVKIFENVWIPNLNPGGPIEYQTKYSQRLDTTDCAGRSWWWIKCNQLAFFQVAPATGAIRSQEISLDWHRQRCNALFGNNQWPDVNATNAKYGGRGLNSATHIIFPNGSQDPWQRVARLTSDYDRSFYEQYIECGNCGHVVDLRGCPSNGPHTAAGCMGNGVKVVQSARAAELGLIESWTNQ